MLGVMGGGGCAPTSNLLVDRFSREHSCQKDRVRVRDNGGNGYLAEGCGQRAEYVCSHFAGKKGSENTDCVERGVVPPAGIEPERPRPMSLEPPK
jgi:hypothetical protein